jgi:hypothetical protein
MLGKLWKPEVYHGKTNIQGTFFEGWFYKIVDKSERHVYAFIPGIFVDKEKKCSHSFIQILNGEDHSAYYIKYPEHEFNASGKELDVKIGNSRFKYRSLELNIEDDINVKGNLNFSRIKQWPVKTFSPGAMGWYTFVPFMQTYHGILSLNHSIEGTLNINGENIDFTGGKGYMEKDWGSAFPSAYVWIQSNHFSDESISITASIAKIPWLGSYFRGFIIGVNFNEELIKFTTYNGSSLQGLSISESEINFSVENKNHKLFVNVLRKDEAVLKGPYDDLMASQVSESLNSTLYIELKHKKQGILFAGGGKHAGVDVNGTLEDIISNPQ